MQQLIKSGKISKQNIPFSPVETDKQQQKKRNIISSTLIVKIKMPSFLTVYTSEEKKKNYIVKI